MRVALSLCMSRPSKENLWIRAGDALLDMVGTFSNVLMRSEKMIVLSATRHGDIISREKTFSTRKPTVNDWAFIELLARWSFQMELYNIMENYEG